jgi:hypothetical protein
MQPDAEDETAARRRAGRLTRRWLAAAIGCAAFAAYLTFTPSPVRPLWANVLSYAAADLDVVGHELSFGLVFICLPALGGRLASAGEREARPGPQGRRCGNRGGVPARASRSWAVMICLSVAEAASISALI